MRCSLTINIDKAKITTEHQCSVRPVCVLLVVCLPKTIPGAEVVVRPSPGPRPKPDAQL